MSKLKFDREYMGAWVPVERYYTDSYIYTSKDFTRDLHVKVQVISNSGVVGHHYNGVTYNAIKNVVRISITIIIRASMRWHDASEKNLWPMAMAHDVHLHNHTPKMSSCVSPEEVLTSSKSSHSALHNAHPWVFPAYVLEPRFQYGNKFLKCIIRSRRYQYLEASPLYVSTVGLVRNYKLEKSALNFIWYLMGILRLCM